MSGGHFDYQQYRLHDIAQQIAELIESNDDTTRNSYGETTGHGFTAETIARFREAVRFLRIAEIYAQRVDWLVSCDDGEDSFHKRLADDLAKVEGDERDPA
jgi:hypothetical protein